MGKDVINKQKILDDAKPLFEKYENLEIFPIAAWGRLYKYEGAGGPWECDGPISEYVDLADGDGFDKALILEIEAAEDANFYFDREDLAYQWGDEDHGTILAVCKDEDGELKIQCFDCDSPE